MRKPTISPHGNTHTDPGHNGPTEEEKVALTCGGDIDIHGDIHGDILMPRFVFPVNRLPRGPTGKV